MLPATLDRLICDGALTRGASGLKSRPKPAQDTLLTLLNQPSETHALASGLHLFQSNGTATMPSACGFVASLMSRLGHARRGTLVWLTQGLAEREWGAPSPLGLWRLGLNPQNILAVQSRTVVDFLWSLEQAIATKGVACVVAETPDEAAFGLTETRRMALKSAKLGVPCYLLAPAKNKNKNATSTTTRWSVTPAPSRSADALLGFPAWRLTLDKNRNGPCATGSAAFNTQTHRFIAPDAATGPHLTSPALQGEVANVSMAEDTIGSAVVHLSSIRRQKFVIAKERS